MPIEVVDGNEAPYIVGASFHYENKSGDIIHHPNAYRRAWGKPIYIASTKKIVVGKKWLKTLEIDLLHVRLSKEQNRFVSREVANFIFNFGA